MPTETAPLATFTNYLKHTYEQFLQEPTVHTNIKLKQMPTFQLEYYLKQARNKHLLVTVTFNDNTPQMIGYLKLLNDQRYLIYNADQTLIRITNISEIKAIAINQ